MSIETQDCPKCGDECCRDSVDVGVGIIHGPWGCPSCGWSEDSDYDRSEGPAAADTVRPGWYSDQWGNLHSKAGLAEDLEAAGARFGLDLSDVITDLTAEKSEEDVSHTGMHEAFEAERKKQLTEKERETLQEILMHVVRNGEKCDASTLFRRFNPNLTPQEAMALVGKIWP